MLSFAPTLYMDRDATAILLGHEKWKEMLKSSLVAGDRITTPMRELITVMPGNLGTISSSVEMHPQIMSRVLMGFEGMI